MRERAGTLVLCLLVATAACGESDPVASEVLVDPAGVWTFGIVVTVATGACAGEEGESSANAITITKTGSEPPYAITATGFLGDPGNTLTGTFYADNRLVLSGSYSEDGGTTSPSYELVAVSNNRMEGTEDWNWTGASGSCPGSQSIVTANRIS